MPFGEDTKELEFMSHAQGNLGVGEPGFFSGFGKGIGMYSMRGFAETARAIDLLGSVPPVLMDKLSGGTTRGDEYFKQHEDVFGNAVDYWTPKPGEVGAGGQIVGSLAGALPQIMVNPALGVGTAVLAPAEDLTKAGVGPGAAITVGMIQGAALAAGIRMPFLGSTLATKMATGAGGNLLQGVLAAAGSKGVLDATGNEKAAEGFQPFDVTQRAVDVLMGLAFGGLAHLDAKAQAAYRAAFTEDIKSALLVKNQAMQLEATANSYKASTDLPEHLNVKVNGIQAAVEQALHGEPVSADRGSEGLFTNTPEAQRRWQEEVHTEAVKTAKETINEVLLRNEQLRVAQETPGFQRTPEQMIQLKAGQIEPQGPKELQRAVEIANKPGFQRSAEEKLYLESVMSGKAFDHLHAPIEPATAVDFGLEAMKSTDLDAQIKDLTDNRAQTISDATAELRAQGIKSKEAKKQAQTLYEAKLAELTAAKKPAQNAQEAPGAAQAEAGTGARPEPGSTVAGGKAQPEQANATDPVVQTARTIAAELPDMRVPTGEVDANGNPITMTATEYLAHADEVHRINQADAGLFKTAITCLLGVL